MSEKYKEVFGKVVKDPSGKLYSDAERTAVAKRWFTSKGSKTPTSEEAENFMHMTMKRNVPSTNNKASTRRSGRISNKRSSRKTRSSRKEPKEPKEPPTPPVESETSSTRKNDLAEFLYQDDPLQDYEPAITSSLGTSKMAGAGASSEEVEMKTEDSIDAFKKACEAYISTTQTESSTGSPTTLFVFVPSESQLAEDRFGELHGEDNEEYLMAHIALPLPRAKGMQDFSTLNEKQWSVRAQGNKMFVKSSQPFGGSFTLKKESENVKKLAGFKNMHVKYCFLEDNEGSMLW